MRDIRLNYLPGIYQHALAISRRTCRMHSIVEGDLRRLEDLRLSSGTHPEIKIIGPTKTIAKALEASEKLVANKSLSRRNEGTALEHFFERDLFKIIHASAKRPLAKNAASSVRSAKLSGDAGDHTASRSAIKLQHLPLQLVDGPKVIVVQEGDEVATRLRQTAVASSSLSGVGLIEAANATGFGERTEQLCRIVLRSIVNHDDFVIREALRKHRI